MAGRYDIHPSKRLRELFAAMPVPYQGQDPRRASVLFVGLDANYSADVFEYPSFRNRIFEYHRDGVMFWRRYGVHHPFLLDEYPLKRNQGGVPYHRKFARMGLTPDMADQVSFVELLPVPTTGSTTEKRFWELFDLQHARQLERLFQEGSRRLILFPGSVLTKMLVASKRFDVFRWLPKQINWGLFERFSLTELHKVRHFSGAISAQQLASMGDLIRDFSRIRSRHPDD